MIFLINQKGQAFSVFELLIAAIVAVAILFVLLPIVTSIVLPTGDAVTTISNAVSSTTNTSTETQTFEIKAKQTILASAFSNKGVDACAVFFTSKPFDAAQVETISENDGTPFGDMQCKSYIVNKTNSGIRARATVVCETSVASLKASLETSGLIESMDEDADIDSFWNEDTDGSSDYTKVCVVFIRRA